MRRTLAGLALLVAACASPPEPDPGAIARAYAAAGRHDEAAREIDVAVRAHPDDAELRKQAASIHAMAGDLPRAIGHLEVGIQAAPSDAELWVQLAQLEMQRENVADAYVAYRRAAALAPDDIRAVSGLALSADQLGFEEEASDAYARWAELERLQQQTPAPNGQRSDSPRGR
jgi:Flp pilus assembly protein TadD